jgi:hypothetical protein
VKHGPARLPAPHTERPRQARQATWPVPQAIGAASGTGGALVAAAAGHGDTAIGLLTLTALALACLLLAQGSRPGGNERLNSVTGLPTPLRILCRLTRGNRQPCHPAALELTAMPFCSCRRQGTWPHRALPECYHAARQEGYRTASTRTSLPMQLPVLPAADLAGTFYASNATPLETIGWPEFVRTVDAVWASLPPASGPAP